MLSQGAHGPEDSSRHDNRAGRADEDLDDTMPAALKALEGYLKNRVLVIPAAGPFVVGRSLEADLVLFGPDVEDRHLVLVPEGPGHRVVPVATRGATRIDGELLRAARALRDGDVIALGGHVFAYVSGLPDGASPTGGGRPVACAACRTPTSPHHPGVLALAHGLVCPRCVDRRLFAHRDIDRFRVLRKVASNEEEITYLAIDREDDARVALRILKTNREVDPRRVRRFVARAMVGLVIDHPNYVPVRSLEARHGICFAVSDHHEGLKLERLIRERSPLAPTAALTVANQLAEVLRHGRARRIVVAKRRRTGVVVDRRLWVKVMAFDLTLSLEAAAAATAAFRELAARCGFDPAKLNPPTASAPTTASTADEDRLLRLAPEAAEVFSVGRVLFHLLTGRAFAASAPNEIRAASARVGRRPARAVGLDAVPPEVLHVLDAILVPVGPDRLRTLDALIGASKDVLISLGAPAALEAGELDLDGFEDDDEDEGGSV